MAWLGLVTLITIYWCVFMSAASGRLGWWIICTWLVPIFTMTLTYEEGMEINGLMVLICISMFLICRKGMLNVRMWNTRQRKQRNILFASLYILLYALFLYCFAEAQMQGYMLNIQGWGSKSRSFWPLFFTLMPMSILNWYFTRMVYTTVDRLYCKPKELILLSCNFYIANHNGGEKGLQKGYFLEGVQNGITYYFRMTRRTFYRLRKEPHLRLAIGVGLLGGQYITTLDYGEETKQMRRNDRQDTIMSLCCFVVVLVAGVWLYWFRG